MMERLVGQSLPAVALASTLGGWLDLSRIPGRAVIFCYPWSGRPGVPDPPGWDDIPGAHGSTPQARAYRDAHPQFAARRIAVFGLSLQDREHQREFAQRLSLPFALLSDAEGAFSGALGLPRFATGGTSYLERLTLLVEEGCVRWVRYPVPVPEGDAAEVLAGSW